MVQINKRSALASVTPHARSGRRVNSEQVSVAIDMGQDNVSLDDEDDDKGELHCTGLNSVSVRIRL